MTMWRGSERGQEYILSSLDTFLPFPHTRKCHYRWFRRCKEGTRSFFCNFATEARMDWEELFVIVGLCALLHVWRSNLMRKTFLFQTCLFSSLSFSLFHPKSSVLFCVGLLPSLLSPLPQPTVFYFGLYLLLFIFLYITHILFFFHCFFFFYTPDLFMMYILTLTLTVT